MKTIPVPFKLKNQTGKGKSPGILLAILTLFSLQSLKAQEILTKDIDGDAVKDTVRLDTVHWQLEVKLSSHGFISVKSAAGIDHSDMETTYLSKEKEGFSYNVQYMRTGFSVDFQYDKATKRVRLTGMEEWNAPSGRSGGDGEALDLLAGDLTIRSTYWDKKTDGWGSAAPIEKKRYYPKVYLSDFTTAFVDHFRAENARLAWGYSDQDLALADDTVKPAPGYQYTWLGKLGRDIPVFISYQNTRQAYGKYGEIIVGAITYLKTKKQIPIPLLGYKDSSGNLRLSEYAPSGEITGVITAKQKGRMLEGSWSKPYANNELRLKTYYLGIQLPHKEIAVKSQQLFGTYHFEYSEEGPQGDIAIKRINDKQATLSMFGVTGAPARNIADGGAKDTIALPQKSSFTYDIPSGISGYASCSVALHFFKNFVVVYYPRGGKACRAIFGHNATLEGIYYKKD